MVARNALFVESMDHNLVLPFIMRESGLEVDELAKIHAEIATKQHHSIYSKECDFRIALKLQGIFSVFNTYRLNDNEVAESMEYDIIFITPDADTWSPSCDAWAEQEDEMLDEHG